MYHVCISHALANVNFSASILLSGSINSIRCKLPLKHEGRILEYVRTLQIRSEFQVVLVRYLRACNWVFVYV